MAKKYDIDFLKKVSQKLENIPNYSAMDYSDEKTLVEAIEILKPTIKELSKKGYKASLISEILIREGIDASPQYLQKLVQQILTSNKKSKVKLENKIIKSDNKTNFTVNEDTEQL